MRNWVVAVGVCALAIGSVASGQEKPAEVPQEAPKVSPMSPTARLTGAKTVYIRKGRGSEIALNVITSGLEGWGRYKIVESPKEADLVVEVSAPQDGSGVSISSSTSNDAYGKPQESSKTTKELSGSSMVTMTVYDTRNNVPLWRGSEQAKSAMKQKAREDNLVEASQKLLAKFRDRVEPVK